MGAGRRWWPTNRREQTAKANAATPEYPRSAKNTDQYRVTSDYKRLQAMTQKMKQIEKVVSLGIFYQVKTRQALGDPNDQRLPGARAPSRAVSGAAPETPFW
jgi:hypothetical protein